MAGSFDSLLLAADSARLAPFPDATLLFVEDKQLLFGVSEFVATIWDDLQTGLPIEQFHARADAAGVDPEETLEGLFSAAAIERLTPAAEGAVFHDRMAVDIAGLGMVFLFDGVRAAHLARETFGYLEVPPRPRMAHVLVGEDANGATILHPGEDPLTYPWPEVAAALKAALTMQALELTDLTALHTATVVRDGQAMLLLGSPGAGKSTLSIALEASGFALAGDDIALLGEAGQVTPLPLPLTLKENTPALLRDWYPDLADLPERLRTDGVMTRYRDLSVASPVAAHPVRMILQLERAAGASPELSPLDVQGTFAAVLRDAWSGGGALTRDAFEDLSAMIGAARCRSFRYSDLKEAVAFLNAAWAGESTP